MTFVLSAAEMDRLCIVLVGSRNPLNIGAAARAMSNFGFLRLRVVRPYSEAFREARSAVDAESVLTVAEEFDDISASIADCVFAAGTTGAARRNLKEPLHRLEAGAALLREHLRAGSRVALLFGSEKTGLSGQDLSRCQFALRIPTRTEHPSMNLGQAVAIVLYELIRQRDSEPLPPAVRHPLLATAGEKERLISVVLEALLAGGSAHHGTEDSLEEKVRQLVRDMLLTQRELNEWLGVYRQLLWKIRMRNSASGD